MDIDPLKPMDMAPLSPNPWEAERIIFPARPDGEFPGGGHLSENLHTFVRALGHKIQPEQDRDSKLLARLRLGPAGTSYKRRGEWEEKDEALVEDPCNVINHDKPR